MEFLNKKRMDEWMNSAIKRSFIRIIIKYFAVIYSEYDLFVCMIPQKNRNYHNNSIKIEFSVC
jgi:hypothetical protein